jgi:hypothetical protein
MSSSALSSSAAPLRCHSAGRFRGFLRNRILLAGWKPHALPAAGSDAMAAQELAHLVGPAMLEPMNVALDHADREASHVGGCARDAYTVLYACAAFAVLFAACGVTTDNHLFLNLLVLAELAMLVVLLLTFRSAHRTNWHGRWMALRYHVEFLRCLPITAATHPDSLHARQAREDAAPAAAAQLSHVPHLAALHAHHAKPDDAGVAAHDEALRADRARLYLQLRAHAAVEPARYAARALAYGRVLAGQQLRYHCIRAQQEQAIVHRVHALSMAAFGLTVVAVLVHFWWHSALLTVICTGVPAFAASLHGFLAQEESERLAASFSAMAVRLHDWLERPDGADLAAMQERLGELAELLMGEMQDWHRLFGDKGMYHLG